MATFLVSFLTLLLGLTLGNLVTVKGINEKYDPLLCDKCRMKCKDAK